LPSREWFNEGEKMKHYPAKNGDERSRWRIFLKIKELVQIEPALFYA